MFGFRRKPQPLMLKIAYVVEEDGDGYHAYAPALKGLHVDGGTREHAIRNLLDAIKVYMESIAQNEDPLPIGPDLTVHEEPVIPPGAFLSSVTLEWPSLQMSGIN